MRKQFPILLALLGISFHLNAQAGLRDTVICDGGSAVLAASTACQLDDSIFTLVDSVPILPGAVTSIVLPVNGICIPFPNVLLQSVTVDISQNITGHLNLFLISPSGETVMLSTGNGGFTNSGYRNVTFLPSAATSILSYVFSAIPPNITVRPEQVGGWGPLVGSVPTGNWILSIQHNQTQALGGQTGLFRSLSLRFNLPPSTTYLWSNGETTPTITVSPNTTTTYTVERTIAPGQALLDTVTVFIQNALNAPQPTCTLALSDMLEWQWATVASAHGYSVSVDGGPFVSIGLQQNFSLDNLSQGQAVSLSVIAEPAPNSPCGSSSPATVVCTTAVCALPTLQFIGNFVLCGNDTDTLTVLPAGLGQYEWSDGATGNSIIMDTAGIFSVTLTDALGCTASASQSVQGFPAPVRPIIVFNNNTISISNGTYATYQWLGNGVPIPGATGPTYTPTLTGYYSVLVSNANGCTTTSLLELFIQIVGLPQLPEQLWAVFPNPAREQLFVELPDVATDGLHWVLYNATGQAVRRWAGDGQTQLSLDVRGLPTGLYRLQGIGQHWRGTRNLVLLGE